MKKYIYLIFICSGIYLACNKQVRLQEVDGDASTNGSDSLSLVEKTHPDQTETLINSEGTYTFTLSTKEVATVADTLSLDKANWDALVKSYNTYMYTTEYKVMPEANYSVDDVILSSGSSSVDITVNITNFSNLSQGNYILPLRYVYNGQSVIHIVRIFKDAPYVALSATSLKPFPPGVFNCPNRTVPMKMVAYVQTNDWDMRNYGQFVLKGSQKPVFDYVVLFAVNMNYDASAKRRVLFFNDKLQPVVRDPQKFIKPLKDRGIKVILSILPNHQGVGFNNFQSYAEALDFAQQCKQAADNLGLDGFDIDEEYADYSVLPSKPTNTLKSNFWFLQAMKATMPDKLITLYEYSYGLTSTSRDSLGKAPSDYIDISWSDYNVTSASRIGMPSNRYGNRSVEANLSAVYFTPTYSGTGLTTPATNNLNSCYGHQMIFNILGTSIQSGGAARSLSMVTQLFYGDSTKFVGSYY